MDMFLSNTGNRNMEENKKENEVLGKDLYVN